MPKYAIHAVDVDGHPQHELAAFDSFEAAQDFGLTLEDAALRDIRDNVFESWSPASVRAFRAGVHP